MAVCATIVIAMQTMTVLLKLPTKGRKKTFSMMIPKAPMTSTDSTVAAQGLKPSLSDISKPIYPPIM